jgi:hypothetical protein
MKHATIGAARLLGFAVLVWIGSACGGDRTVAPALLIDGFSGTFPGANWTVPATTGTGVAPTIVASGNPSPSLQFSSATTTGTASTTTTSSFNNPGVSLSVQEAVTTATPALQGSSTISIQTTTLQATAVWDNATGQVTFMITGTVLGTTSAVASDGTFHTFKFSVDAGGNATWYLDGAVKQTKPGFPAGMLQLMLSAGFTAGPTGAMFRFDNVAVTNP